MEIEGFGVSLVGRSTWVHGDERTLIPWEFLQNSQYALRILVRPEGAASVADIEKPWTCVWSPTSARDWSCIATVLRSAAGAPCLLVLEAVVPPPNFWGFLESLGRTVTRVWVHTEAPPWVPDATFFGPQTASGAELMRRVFEAMPARGGHGHWLSAHVNWEDLVTATNEQGLGLVLTDVEEQAWTVLWHRVEDSRGLLEKRVKGVSAWIQAATRILDV